MRKNVTATLVALGLAVSLAGGARAANLVQNGDFEILSNGTGQLGYNTDATGWTTNGYNFVFASGTADTTGSNGSFGGLQLWGPNNGSANGLPATSPTGGNYVGADGAFEVGSIDQTIHGLTAGHQYEVSFDWGAAQQRGFDGATTDMWTVSLGNESHNTAIDSIDSHGFSGWQHQSFVYTADSDTEVLKFLATGTPDGVPPFALLDGVSLKAVPEASTTVSLFIGFVVLGAFLRRARAKKATA